MHIEYIEVDWIGGWVILVQIDRCHQSVLIDQFPFINANVYTDTTVSDSGN